MSARSYDFRLIPLEAIDPPAITMREHMDDRKLEELAASIRSDGLRQPIGVRPVGDRYRVAYGHRRLIACGLVGEAAIPCFVLADDSDEEEAAKIAENWLREDTNPAEDATYFAYLLEHRYDGNIELLCRSLGVKESRVQGRLDLLRGDSAVLEALRASRITLAVARELNRMKDEGWRRHYLADAIEQGATASVVQRWRIDADRRAELARTSGAEPDADASAAAPVPLTSIDRCLLCALDDDPLEMEFVRVHRSCHTQHRRLQRAAERSVSS